MSIGIYVITSPSNKIYVGQSWNIESRKKAYQYLKCKDQPRIYNSLLKYGWSSHTFESIFELRSDISQEWLNYWEQFFMDYYRSEGYELLNLKEAGSNGKHSEITILKMKKLKTKFNGMRGKKLSEEVIQKMKAAQKNHKPTHFKSVEQYDLKGNLLATHDTMRSAAKTVNGSHNCISGVCSGLRKHHKGFFWKQK